MKEKFYIIFIITFIIFLMMKNLSYTTRNLRGNNESVWEKSHFDVEYKSYDNPPYLYETDNTECRIMYKNDFLRRNKNKLD